MVNWKSRYAELFDKQERQQERYKRRNALLFSALSSLGVLAKGVDSGADAAVLSLQALLRRDKLKNSDFDPVVSTLSKQAKLSLKARKTSLKLIRTDLGKLSKGMAAATTDETSLQSLKKFEKELSKDDIAYTDLLALINRLVSLQGVTQKHSKNMKTSSLWRMFSNTTSSQSPDSKSTDSKSTDSNDASTAEKSDELVSKPPESKLLSNLTESLSELMGDLTPPARVEAKYHQVVQSLAALEQLQDLPRVLLSVCDIVSATLQNDHDEFEIFLNQLNERLREVTLGLSVSKGQYEDEINANEKLDKSLRLSVGRIKSSVSSATDLEQLKSEVSANIDQMVTLMDNDQQEGAKRHHSLSTELGSLIERVKHMEDAAQLADERVKEQRALALTDSLTKLPNREAYVQRAAQEIARWQRYDRPLCLAVCDIDLFKRVNDDYGHAAGDEVLTKIAEIMGSRLRESDFVARFGGEEFVVLLPETDIEQAFSVMEAVRLAVESTAIHLETQKISTTISIGIVSFQGKDNLESAFTRADRALYKAKDAGRNRCMAATDVSL